MEILDNVSPILFILIGVAVLLAREPIRKAIFPKLPPKRGSAILLVFVIVLELFAVFLAARDAFREGRKHRQQGSGAASELHGAQDVA